MMLKLILVILSPLAVSFACGYGTRDWISRRRRKGVRKKFYKRYPKTVEHTPKAEAMTGATRREPTIKELHDRLSRLDDQIAKATSVMYQRRTDSTAGGRPIRPHEIDQCTRMDISS